MAGFPDLRKEDREPRHESIYVEVLSTAANEQAGVVVKCTTQDISANGLKIVANHPISIGAILELLVDFDKESVKYLLTGEVKWCKQIGSGTTYECGFELVEAEHSDILNWRELFAETV